MTKIMKIKWNSDKISFKENAGTSYIIIVTKSFFREGNKYYPWVTATRLEPTTT